MDDQLDIKLNFGLLMTALVSGAFLMGLATSTISVALPALMSQFSASLDTVKWTMSGFMLATGASAPLAATIGNKLGYKTLYSLAVVGFLVSSTLCAGAWSIESLIIFRILQGIFYGFSVPATMAIIYQIVPGQKLAFALSLWSLAATLSPAVGPTLSGFLIDQYGWYAIFLANLPIGLVALLLILMGIPKYKLNEASRSDLTGLSTSVIASVLLLLAFSEGPRWGWLSTLTLTSFGLGGLTLAFFIYFELKTAHPALDLRIFRNSAYLYSVILRAIITLALYAGGLLTPLFLQQARGISASQTGLTLLPSSLIMALGMVIVGRLYNRVSPRLLIIAGVLMISISSLLMSVLTLQTTTLYVLICMAVRNLGLAIAMVPASNFGMAALERRQAGSGSSLNNWIAQSVGCLSISLATSLLTSRSASYLAELTGPDRGPLSIVKGANDVFLISGLVILLAIPFTLKMKTGVLTSDPGRLGGSVSQNRSDLAR